MRSLLFVPADSERKLTKGLASGADALILDLEDSVAPANRPAARTLTAAFIAEARKTERRPLLYVRINPLDGDGLGSGSRGHHARTSRRHRDAQAELRR